MAGVPTGAEPVLANIDSSLTVSAWPAGQAAGSPASLIGRRTSKTASQLRHRNSYNAMGPA